MLANFYLHWTCVSETIAKLLWSYLLKNSQSIEAVNEFFDPPNREISSCDEYQNWRITNYLSAVKNLEHLDKQNTRYEFSCNGQHFCQSCYPNRSSFIFRNYIPCTLGLYTMSLTN